MCLRLIAVLAMITHFFLHKNRSANIQVGLWPRFSAFLWPGDCAQWTARRTVSNIREGVMPPLPVSCTLLWRPGCAATAHLGTTPSGQLSRHPGKPVRDDRKPIMLP